MLVMCRQFLCLLALLSVCGVVQAEDPRRAGTGDARETARDGRELRDSVRRVERDTGGSVLRAERVHGRQVNRVKVLTPEGRVRVVHEDQGRQTQRPVQEHNRDTQRPARRTSRGRDD